MYTSTQLSRLVSMGHLLTTLDQLPLRIFIRDVSGCCVSLNQAAARAYGFQTLEEACGHTPNDFFAPEYAKVLLEDDRQVLDTGRPDLFKPKEEINKNGEKSWAMTSRVPLRDENGKITAVAAVAWDMTDEDTELMRYQLALAATRDGFWHRDLRQGDEHDLWMSKQWKGMLGYEEYELQEKWSEWEQRLHPEDHGRVLTEIENHLQGKTKSYECEYRMRHKSQGWVWIRARGLVQRDTHGQPVYFAGSHTDIAAEKEREFFLTRMIDSLTNTFVFAKNSRGQFTFVNKALADAFGKAKEDVLGRTDAKLNANADEVRHFEEDDRKVLEGDVKWVYGTSYRTPIDLYIPEEEFTDAEGHTRYLATFKEPYEIPGKGRHVIGVSTDVSDLHVARQELEHERKILQQIMDYCEDAIYVKDVNRRFVTINPRMAEIAGLDDPADAVGKTHHDLFSFAPKHAEMAEVDEKEILAKRSPITNENWVRSRKDQSREWYSVTRKVPIIENDVVTGILAISRDTTELKRSEELMYAIFDTLPQIVFLKDRESRFKKWNKSFAEWHRPIGIKEYEGLTDSDLWKNDPDQAKRYRDDDLEVMESREPKGPITETQTFPDGTKRTIETRKFPVFDKHGEVIGLLGIFEDVTERRRAEKDKVYRDLARTIGHALRTWMGSLEANCNRQIRDSGNTPALERLEGGIRFLKHFANISTGFATIGSDVHLDEQPIEGLIRSAVDQFDDRRIRLIPSDADFIVKVSEFHIQLAITELVTNALRFAPAKEEGGEIRISWCKDGERYSIHIEDNGPGVVERLKETMYEAGETAERGAHPGLGLTYVKQVAALHLGSMTEVGAPGKGAHFVLRAPITPG